jgi:membrane associated rhomboid family serine protease
MFIPIGDDNIRGGHYPLFSYGLIVLNVVIFLYQVSLSPPEMEHFIYQFGSIPADTIQGKHLYTLFTSMFIHGGILHLVGNMLFLWIFADNVEATIGNFRFLLFYLIGGLWAHALHIFFASGSQVPTIGASGAIAAVMGAYLIMYPRSQIKVLFIIFPFRISAWLFLGLWIFSQWTYGTAALQVQTEQTTGVAYWAHIGGFVYGAAMGFYYRHAYDHPELREPRTNGWRGEE